ncbi:protein ASPARTIC PROTEASE IN GUARD CELL 1-like [Andrographis paniculata]|uniref:protein ASPARTIC PROTEASE IN GUARD CELL 1-like n=1 Tax=Andrographis paniculata TaxID=175694 RepID=UPI0021E896F7|nr:protein ASPARTIC PROTEASE IN GUARD CELL 1-like [Andrographis paniculata]
MADSQIPQTLLLLSFLIFITASASSQDHTNHGFQILDISSSLKMTREVFSAKSSQPYAEQLSSLAGNHSAAGDAPPSFSFTIHPRYSLPFADSHGGNYTALSLARLARDESHVRSRFSGGLAGDQPRHRRNRHSRSHSASYYRNLQCRRQPEQQLRSPLISGVSFGSGEYFARVGIGRPAAEYYLILDTGSDISWIQCKPCINCYPQTDPIFNPTRSTTYRVIPCRSPTCSAAGITRCSVAGNCLYQIHYGDGSATVGHLSADTFTFGATGTVANLTFGCGNDNEGLFSSSAGLIAVDNGPLSVTAQIKATSFSYCLVNRDSQSVSTLDFNSAAPPDSVVAPMVRHPILSYFYIGLAGILIGGRPVAIPKSMFEIEESGWGGVIVDSGTSVTRFHPETYAVIRDAFRSMAAHLPPAAGVALFDTCYDFSRMKTADVPTFGFEFSNGQKLSLPARNYLVPVDHGGRFCFAVAETTGPTAIIGNVQQQGTRVTYDLVNRVIGFSQNKC